MPVFDGLSGCLVGVAKDFRVFRVSDMCRDLVRGVSLLAEFGVELVRMYGISNFRIFGFSRYVWA